MPIIIIKLKRNHNRVRKSSIKNFCKINEQNCNLCTLQKHNNTNQKCNLCTSQKHNNKENVIFIFELILKFLELILLFIK